MQMTSVMQVDRVVEIEAGQDREDVGLQECDQQFEAGEGDQERRRKVDGRKGGRGDHAEQRGDPRVAEDAEEDESAGDRGEPDEPVSERELCPVEGRQAERKVSEPCHSRRESIGAPAGDVRESAPMRRFSFGGSIKSFIEDPGSPRRAAWLIVVATILAVVIGGSLLLYAWRAPRVGLGGGFDPVSREAMLLVNNVLLVVAMASVLLGTLYPLFLDALGLGKISVGPPYFDSVFAAIMAPAVFLMGIGPLARWKKADLPDLAVRLRWAFAVSVVCAALLPFVLGRWSLMVSLGLLLCSVALVTYSLAREHRSKKKVDTGVTP